MTTCLLNLSETTVVFCLLMHVFVVHCSRRMISCCVLALINKLMWIQNSFP